MVRFLQEQFEKRCAVALVLGALCLSAAVGARATELPTQMIIPPMGGDPIGLETSAPKQFVAHFFELPDDRRAQLHRLSWWTTIGRSHAAQVTLDYAGLESDQEIRHGGGRAEVRWTSRVGPVRGRGFAIDLAGNLPTGDEGLFPLSAKAPMVEARLRWSLFDSGWGRAWIGYWGRRLSPPSASVRQDPLRGFPSGSGFDGLFEARTDWGEGALLVRIPTGGGIADAPWFEGHFDLRIATDLRLRLGASIATSPAATRPIDHGIAVGVVWLPRPIEESDATR